ncbi:MAG TPA: hypothetical protein VGN00_13125 [Puia sp.]
MKRLNRKINGKNKFTDTFSGNGYEAIITCAQISQIVDHSSLYKGTLAIKKKGSRSTFAIHGKVDSY